MYNIANIITIHVNTSISEIILETLQTIERGTRSTTGFCTTRFPSDMVQSNIVICNL